MFDEDIEDTASEDALNAQGKRIKLASTPGKLKKGDDFWSRFDTYLAGKITLYGKDLTGEAWNGYIVLPSIIYCSHLFESLVISMN